MQRRRADAEAVRRARQRLRRQLALEKVGDALHGALEVAASHLRRACLHLLLKAEAGERVAAADAVAEVALGTEVAVLGADAHDDGRVRPPRRAV